MKILIENRQATVILLLSFWGFFLKNKLNFLMTCRISFGALQVKKLIFKFYQH